MRSVLLPRPLRTDAQDRQAARGLRSASGGVSVAHLARAAAVRWMGPVLSVALVVGLTVYYTRVWG